MNVHKNDMYLNQGIIYDNLTKHTKDLVASALKHGASRRDAIKLLMASGMSLAVASTVVTSAKKAAAATPVKGGSVKMASSMHGPDDRMIPCLGTSNIDYTRFRCHYGSLVQLDDNIVPQPELAEEFGANANATEWTFKLRKGVEFHDGSELTADDVMYTMAMHYGEDSTSVVKTLVSSVKEWKKVGPYEVKAILDYPNADLATVLGEKQLKIMKTDTRDMPIPPGTGPFKTTFFEPGVRSMHERNENYWREGANFDEIEMFAITDPVARVNALLSGDIDLMGQVDPKAIKQVEESELAKVKSTPSGAYMGICMMLDRAPGNDPDFVKGMKLLHRREKLVKSVLKGHGTVGNDHPINVAYGVDHCAELPLRAYDPEQAKFHLNKSGVTSAECYVAEVIPGVTEAALKWQQECLKIGFDLQIKKVPTDGYWGAVWMQKPINVVTWNMRPTATIMLDIAFAPDAPWNDTYWKDDRMGKLLTMAKAETNPEKRYEIQCEMQTLAHNGSGMVIPAHSNYVDGTSKKIHGIPNLALGVLGGCEWPEFAWKEA